METNTNILPEIWKEVKENTIEARHKLDALHNARLEVFMLGGDVRNVYFTN